METPAHPQTITINRFASSSTLKDSDNGSTLAGLGFKQNDSITVTPKK